MRIINFLLAASVSMVSSEKILFGFQDFTKNIELIKSDAFTTQLDASVNATAEFSSLKNDTNQVFAVKKVEAVPLPFTPFVLDMACKINTERENLGLRPLAISPLLVKESERVSTPAPGQSTHQALNLVLPFTEFNGIKVSWLNSFSSKNVADNMLTSLKNGQFVFQPWITEKVFRTKPTHFGAAAIGELGFVLAASCHFTPVDLQSFGPDAAQKVAYPPNTVKCPANEKKKATFFRGNGVANELFETIELGTCKVGDIANVNNAHGRFYFCFCGEKQSLPTLGEKNNATVTAGFQLACACPNGQRESEGDCVV